MQLLVIAKEPRPGFAKTRLCPPFTPDHAAKIAAAGLAGTLTVVARTPASRRVLALDGRPGPWLPPGFTVIDQQGNGLGERLDAALRWCFAGSDEPVVLIGMDTPQVTSARLIAARDLLRAGAGAVLGPATDGGWWLLGVDRYRPGLFAGVAMSERSTGAQQLDRLRRCGYAVAVTEQLRDMDHADDAVALAAGLPGSDFAAAVHAAQASLSPST